MLWFLGVIDLIAAAILLSKGFGIKVPIAASILIPVGLFAKSFINITDIGSITDIAVALLIVLGIFLPIPWPILLIGAIFMIIKGIMSFIVL
ncbi:MAG: hypothetical protein A3H01_00905 [Candidatus Wildermuthbacteria bacterium RIFCSPLOWO2_12_FULL_40_9]|uniref:Uncharacterized protein n=2 Tax=Candidatus Wildermuthiibacteriota TaxID=1817923 RepID=A0A1G2REG7_9BACT|nr:MAG: hypothetical protein A3F15_02125 [Candidatus Wildermuthbacteria bacterium RIFCSPHIGHO2_12_FULL_40_12]OHA76819.1 MAG: hypothetical protein A3H01_00905 [Candidatus Wildermuthbacteria bacterium RIFCSPLOWO2_12_FULL_40_9]